MDLTKKEKESSIQALPGQHRLDGVDGKPAETAAVSCTDGLSVPLAIVALPLILGLDQFAAVAEAARRQQRHVLHGTVSEQKNYRTIHPPSVLVRSVRGALLRNLNTVRNATLAIDRTIVQPRCPFSPGIGTSKLGSTVEKREFDVPILAAGKINKQKRKKKKEGKYALTKREGGK